MRNLTGDQLDKLKKVADYSQLAFTSTTTAKETITPGIALDYGSLSEEELQSEEHALKREQIRTMCMISQEMKEGLAEVIPGIKEEAEAEQQRLQQDANIGTIEKMFSKEKRERRTKARERIAHLDGRKAALDSKLAERQRKVEERSTEADAAPIMEKVTAMKVRYYQGHANAVEQGDTATITNYHSKSSMEIQVIAARIFDNSPVAKKNKAIQKRVNKTSYEIGRKDDGTPIIAAYSENSVYRDLQSHYRKYDDTSEIPDNQMEAAYELHKKRQDEIYVLETGHHLYSPEVQEKDEVVIPILEATLEREDAYTEECEAFRQKHRAILEGTASHLEVVNAVEDFTLFHQKAQEEMYMGSVLRKSAIVKKGSEELKARVKQIAAQNNAMCTLVRDVIGAATSIQKYYQGEADEIATVRSYDELLRDGLAAIKI